jgi:hypothetical protein
MRNLKIVLVFLFALAVVVLAPALAWGQANMTGTITGTITDQSGGVIVGAEVTITDRATNRSQTDRTNQVGRFVFVDLDPGTYDVTVVKSGFRRISVPAQMVMVGKTITLALSMEVGAVTQTVEVTAAPGAELQTLTSTMSTSMNNVTLLNIPSMNRDVSALLNFQPTAAPTFHTEGDVTGGSIAGSTPDQNTFMLDGVNNTSGLEGDNGYINSFSGDQRGIVPTPIESIAEFTVNTNNMTADFNSSSGGELMAVTKRGHDKFHGAAYEFFQGQWLDSNDWQNNFQAVPKPKSHQNRFGFDVGGPMLPHVLGGKTYFFFNYEGERYPFNTTGLYYRTVPSDSLRKGVIQIPTSYGVQSFDLTKALNVCGPTGGLPCDPRSTGMSSVTSGMWSTYMPEGNGTVATGTCNGSPCVDGYNTLSYQSYLTLPYNTNILIGRIDHDFGSKNRFFVRYSWYKQDVPTTDEVDIGGLLKGDSKGVPASASSNNNQPLMFVAALDTSIGPTLSNSFHFGYMRNEWNWIRNGVTPQIAGAPGTVEIDAEAIQALNPVNVNTQQSRNRAWYEHNYDYRDELTWLKGNHMLQFGGDILHEWWHFNRYDNVVGGLTNLEYIMDDKALNMTAAYQPQPCSATVTTQCLDAGDAGEIATWNRFYSDILGIIADSTVVATRTGANLQLNPIGTPAASYVTVNTPSVYINDSWKIRPNLTLNAGLNYMVQMPPYDLNGRQDVLVDPSGNPIAYDDFIAQRQAAALRGQVYLPTMGFSPVGAVGKGLKYPFRPFYGAFGPRVSVAWSPNAGGGILGTLLGHKQTVIRGGYGRFYGRDLGINVVSNPILGDGFLQPVSCTGPSSPTATGVPTCQGPSVATPANAFRMGTNADGVVVPLPAIAQTVVPPVQPGIGTTPYAVLTDSMDNNFRPSDTDQIDFSIQRQLKGNMIAEVGYLGVWGHHLFQGIEMNAVPWMMTLGGQQFQQAWAGLYNQLISGVAPGSVAAQPFFEKALAGTSYCTGFASCTAAVATNQGSAITGGAVTDVWGALDSTWNFGPALYQTNQALTTYANTSDGFSNYQALIMKFTERTSKGLTLNVNATYGHALGTLGLAQTYTLDSPDNVYNLRADWTPQPWDRKFTLNVIGTYELPFGPGHRWSSSNPIVKRLIGGWSVSPLFSYGTGLPVEVWSQLGVGYFDGVGEDMGAGQAENGASAVPVGLNTRTLSNSTQYGITTTGTVGSSENPVVVNGKEVGGSGMNMFGSKAAQVYNSFRPFVLGVDGYPNPDGELRGPTRWNLDLGINKDTKVTERVSIAAYCHMFNAFNHTQFWQPFLDLGDPWDFGVMGSTGINGSQYGNFQGAYTRVIELGLRVSF